MTTTYSVFYAFIIEVLKFKNLTTLFLNNTKKELKKQRRTADTLEKEKEIDSKDYNKFIKEVDKKMNLLNNEIISHKVFMMDLEKIIVNG